MPLRVLSVWLLFSFISCRDDANDRSTEGAREEVPANTETPAVERGSNPRASAGGAPPTDAGFAPPATGARAGARTDPPGRFAVETHGSLYELMHNGKVGPAVALATLDGQALFAVGALSELRGEITIANGIPWLSYPDGTGGIRIASSLAHEHAALLVSAHVPRWRRLTIDRDVSWAELDLTLEQLARTAGYDVEGRLPMRIEGAALHLEWHVLNGAKGGAPGSHHGHTMNAVRGKVGSAAVSLVGFFSKHEQGVFTHMGANTHFHVISAEPQVAGHVDGVTVLRGAELLLPE